MNAFIEVMSNQSQEKVLLSDSNKPKGSDWNAFHKANQGRALRPFYIELQRLLAREGVKSSGAQSSGLKPSGVTPSSMSPKGAMELGCGTGEETLDLLHRGWQVLAIDHAEAAIEELANRVPEGNRSRATLKVSRFEDLTDLKPVHLVYSFQSLSFCPPPEFEAFWKRVLSWVEPGGIFAGTLFGPNDQWVAGGKVSAISEKDLRASLEGFEILHWREIDKLGSTALQGEKHWHYFEVVARKD